MKETALYKRLERYVEDGVLPMHMPGHKRACFEHLASLGAKLDITEIDSFDDLNSPEGIFADSESVAAKLWGSGETLFSVNGSTGAVLAAVRAVSVCTSAKTVIVARNCHKSVYHAIEICSLEAEYIAPGMTSAGFPASVTPESVREALERTPSAAAVILTSPTYEGVISDISSISRICHEKGTVLIVDEAHGAHLSLHGVFSKGAVACGADIVIQSLHKTLPSLTQTAVVHVSGDLVSRAELRRQTAIFQSSSPSYLLSASVDGCVRFLASKEGKECLIGWKKALTEARERMATMENVRLFSKEAGVFALDESKLVLLGDGYGIMEELRCRKVELEMASVSYAVAMTGGGDTNETLQLFTDALCGMDFGKAEPWEARQLHIPASVMTAAEAVTAKAEKVALALAEGRVSAAYVYAYPPGIPILVPGEVLDASVIAEIQRLTRGKVSLRGITDGRVRVIK